VELFGTAEMPVFTVCLSSQLIDTLSILPHRSPRLLRRHVSSRPWQLTVLRVPHPEFSQYISLDGVDPGRPGHDGRLGRVEGVVWVRRSGGRVGTRVV